MQKISVNTCCYAIGATAKHSVTAVAYHQPACGYREIADCQEQMTADVRMAMEGSILKPGNY